MDHQQNYEYTTDPNFGFAFSGGENFMLSQPPQQLNGKSHSHTSASAFDQSSTESSQYISQQAPIMYHLPETIGVTAPTPHFPVESMGYQLPPVQPEITMKDFINASIENPPDVVPANIIQQPEQNTQPVIAALNEPQSLSQSANVPPTVESSTNEQPQETLENLPTNDKPVANVFSPEQNNMMKALGVVRRDVLASGSKKRRRRILQLNEDDSDDENELKKELESQISPEKDREKGEAAKGDTEDSSPDSESEDEPSDPGALKVRSLLKSAVIIQGPTSKKKKQRVLESDEEDAMQTSVDDIGLVESNENENEMEDENFSSDIIVSEPVFEPIESETVEEVSNPVDPHEFAVPAPPPPLDNEKKENKLIESSEKTASPVTNESKDEKSESEISEDGKKIIKTEDSEIDPSMSVEAILENIKPMADDDEFFKIDQKSDESDCQFIPNEEYFGTPDMTKPQPGRKRGPRPNSQKRPQQRSGNQVRRKRGNKYEKDNFVEGSSESEDSTYSESSLTSSSESSGEEVHPRARPMQMKKSPVIVQTKSFSVTRVPIKKKIVKKDRFYDKSRDIPNDIYFGDVKVPLHVLHTRWDSNAESSDSSEPEQITYSKPRNPTFQRFSSFPSSSKMSYVTKPSYSSYNEIQDDPKLSTLKDLVKIAGIKINYAKLYDGIRSTDDKCMLIRRILAQKGLQGEPTVAKCKQLRLELQAKRESAELDKSVIIRAEGRTRRATRNRNSSNLSEPSTSNSPVVQPETLQTLSKIRRVVDSDSE